VSTRTPGPGALPEDTADERLVQAVDRAAELEVTVDAEAQHAGDAERLELAGEERRTALPTPAALRAEHEQSMVVRAR
jgi:hypothetical protein